MIRSIKETYIDFWGFLKKPQDSRGPDRSGSRQLAGLLSLLAIDLPLMGLLGLLVAGLEKWGWVQTANHQVSLLFDLLPIGMALMLTVLIVPFIEEVVFRFPLIYKRNYPFRGIMFLIRGRRGESAVQKGPMLWRKVFPFVFYFSAVAFGAVHVFNYDGQSTVVYLLPVLVLPQFLLGLFFGYLRVRYSFLLGYIMHALHNAIFVVAFLVLARPSVEILDIQAPTYTLKIEEVEKTAQASISLSGDSVEIKGVSLKAIISTLAHTDEGLIESDAPDIMARTIDLKFKNAGVDTSSRDSILLAHLGEAYAFRLEIIERGLNVYDLYVQDPSKLLAHAADPHDSVSSSTLTSDKITLKNMKLEQLVRELGQGYKLRFETKTVMPGQFDIEVPIGKIAELESELRERYGIEVRAAQKRVDCLRVLFSK